MSLELELVWFVVVLAAVIGISWFSRRGAVGLSLAYLISLGFVHFWGGLIHTLPWYHGGELDFTEIGFKQFTWAVAGFAIGCCVLAPVISRALRISAPYPPIPRLAKALVIAGIALYGFLRVALHEIPSIGALATCGGSLLLAGLCLLAYESLQQKRFGRLLSLLLSLGLLPFFTIVSAGFLGYGAAAALVVVAFISCQLRSRTVAFLFLSGAVYLGFCTFMTYMRDRVDIREEMWDEDSTLGERIDRLKTTFTKFEAVDFTNQDQLERIEDRLNQNDLVGRAVWMLDSGQIDYANGETFRQAAISVVPRIVWPSKPVVAGSGDIVSYFTGLTFAPGTSVGIGQVMEGYINFGTPGVVGVFLVFGTALGVIDAKAARKLRDLDTLGFVVWFVPGIALLQPQGSLVDVGTTVAASTVLVHLFKIPFVLRARKLAQEAPDMSLPLQSNTDASGAGAAYNPAEKSAS
jgi:hypothetical protein